MRNASAVVIQSWIDNSSPPGIIDHVGVTEVVQDYEMARRALGYEKINFLGGSQYGSHTCFLYSKWCLQIQGRYQSSSVCPSIPESSWEFRNRRMCSSRSGEPIRTIEIQIHQLILEVYL